MSTYFKKGKGWRYDFTLNGERYTEAWFKTKKEANQAENDKRKEILNPPPPEETPTDMAFLELVNRRLDYLRDWTTRNHYRDTKYRARVWVKKWCELNCNEISGEMIEDFLRERRKVSAITANTELKTLRSLFNYGIKKGWIMNNPTSGIEYYPMDKKRKYIPTLQDIERVILMADPDTQDYLRIIQDTLARVGEINRLEWSDVDFSNEVVTLYTRKKRDRSLTPRQVPMTSRVLKILTGRFESRKPNKPWVFWHRYWSRKRECFVEGPYKSRNKLMARLCKKAGVKHFSFHALRHAGASILEQSNVPARTVQQILGHEDLTTTQIYLQTLTGSEREAMEIFESVVKKSHTESHTDSPLHSEQSVSSFVN